MKTKPTELLDLRTIPTADLKFLAEFCASYKDNKFFEDNFVIITRVLFAQYECCEMNQYVEGELAEAAAVFLDLLERNQSLPADHPARMFLRFNLTAAHDELERRQRQTIMKVVK